MAVLLALDHTRVAGQEACLLEGATQLGLEIGERAGEAVTALAIAPSDAKFATAGNDGLVKVWDFWSTGLEHVLAGHKAGATGVSWHPHKASARARGASAASAASAASVCVV